MANKETSMYITLDKITKSFPLRRGSSIIVINGVSLSIEKGEMVAIKGPSGAGKSTLLHILGCLDHPTSGNYYLDGEEISCASSRRLAEIRNQKIGFVLQHFALIEEDNVVQNVSIPLLFSKVKKAGIDTLVMDQLDSFGIAKLAHKKVSQLSGGEKQRVAIARALINNPDCILADEPTGALDSANTVMIMNHLKKLNQMGKTVIIVTHEEYVAGQCNRTFTISDGMINP